MARSQHRLNILLLLHRPPANRIFGRIIRTNANMRRCNSAGSRLLLREPPSLYSLYASNLAGGQLDNSKTTSAESLKHARDLPQFAY